MKAKNFGYIFLFLFIIAGCATTAQKGSNLQMQQMQERINYLEEELKNKNQEVNRLETELAQKAMNQNSEVKQERVPAEEMKVKKSEPISKKKIQTALKNAGFYKGSVDGKMGLQTKEAIKEFQKANGLKADGKVGKKTWLKLSEYLKN